MKWRIKSSVQWPLPHFYDICSRGCSPMTKTVITRDPLIKGEAKYLDADLKCSFVPVSVAWKEDRI